MNLLPRSRSFLIPTVATLSLLVAAEEPGALARSAHRTAAATARHHARAAATRCPRRNAATGSIVMGRIYSPASASNWLFTGSQLFDVNANDRPFPEMATQVPTLQNGGIRDGGKTYV